MAAAAFYRGAIGFYRRHISPYKGFHCAHAAAHGGPSCSAAIEALLVEQGLWRACPMIRQRLAECRAAALILSDTPSANGTPGPRRPKRQRPQAGRCDPSSDGCSDLACFWIGSDDCDIVGGAADLVAEHCSQCDLGACEIGSCDFW